MTDVMPHSIAPQSPPHVCDARPIHWWAAPFALPAVIFAPTRLGPRLARSSWPIVLAIHAFCLAASLFLAAYAASLIYEPYGSVLWSLVSTASGGFAAEQPPTAFSLAEFLRNAPTAAVNMVFVASDTWGDLYGALLAVVAVHVLHWIVAILAMPFIAAGERPRLLFARAMKLSLWSSVTLPILAITLGSYIVGYVHITGKVFSDVFTPACIVVVWLSWWFSLLTRMGRRYAGPADGPAWRAIEPRCAQCRYILAGLPADGRCPECGLPAVESFSRRGETCPWTSARREISRPMAWLKVLFGVLRRKGYFAKLELPLDLPLAVRFLKWSASMIGAVAAALPLVHYFNNRFVESGKPPLAESLMLSAALFVGVRLLVMWFMSLLAICCGLRPFRDLRWATVPACYCSCLGLPLAVFSTVIVAYFLYYAGIEFALSFARERSFWMVAVAVLVLWVVPFCILVGLTLYQTTAAMQQIPKRMSLPPLPS